MRPSPTSRLAAAAAAALAVLALASCSAPAKTAPPASPSPKASMATTTQYGAALADTFASIHTSWAAWNANCQDAAETNFCFGDGQAISIEAKTLLTSLDTLANPAAAGYIGAPPGSVTNLVALTRMWAQQVVDDFAVGVHAPSRYAGDITSLDHVASMWDQYIQGN